MQQGENTARDSVAQQAGLGSSPNGRSMISTREQPPSSPKTSILSKMFQLFFDTIGAYDPKKPQAPKKEPKRPASTKTTNSTAQPAAPARSADYTSENQHPRLATKIGLAQRLRKAWKDVMPPRESVECIGCTKEILAIKTIVAPCGHKYCRSCIFMMAYTSMKDITLFPVRCCRQEIPAEEVASAMKYRDGKRYRLRVVEHAFPPSERWYCPHIYCSRWIHPRSFEPSKPPECPHCHVQICPKCRDLAHGSRECSVDTSLHDLLKLARKKHWQRCYHCHAMIEKIDGCNQIKCPVCEVKFCYFCSQPWEYCSQASCRRFTQVVTGTAQFEHIGGDLDVTAVVAAMEQAELEDV